MANGFFGKKDKKYIKKDTKTKRWITTGFYIFEISLNRRILNFWTKLTQISDLKRNKRKIIIEFYISELVWILTFSLHKHIFILWNEFAKKRDTSRQKQNYWTSPMTLYIRISLDTKFQLKLTILIFLTKFV